MMQIGFIKPTFPNEKRVALLPKDCCKLKIKPVIEIGFGEYLNINDEEYESEGCILKSREQIFAEHEAIFCLKLLQTQDYDLLRKNQIIIGWTHPNGSGTNFFRTICQDKNLTIIDLDNINPMVYRMNQKKILEEIPKNFIWRNSWLAGFAAVQHALISMGTIPNTETKVAILSAGNVAQGSIAAIAPYNTNMRVFTRSNMDEFKSNLSEFDIIISGIEVDSPKNCILNKNELSKIKKNALIIDAAADAGNSIEGTKYTSIDKPIYREDSIFYYVVNNAPSLYYRKASHFISEAFSSYVYNIDPNTYIVP